MKRWLQKLLGIDQIINTQCRMVAWAEHFDDRVAKVQSDTRTTRLVLSHVVASMIGKGIIENDPRPEWDPKRKAESDKLAEAAINRLLADDKARRHTLGEL